MKIPKGWQYITIDKMATKIGSGVTPRGGAESYKVKGVPLIRSQNVLWGRLDLSNVAYIDETQHNKMNSTFVQADDILLNITGASIGRATIMPSGIPNANVNQHVCIIRLKKGLNPQFFLNCLLSIKGQRQIELFQTSGNRQGLNFEQIKTIGFYTPSYEEQKAIAELLSTWDAAIEKTERLIALKKIRFKCILNTLIVEPSLAKKWKRQNLDAIFEPVNRKNTIGETNVLTSSAQQGLVSQTNYYKKSVSAEDVSGYYLLEKGEFAYNRSSSNGYPYGAIKRLDESERGVLSTLYLCMRIINEKQVNSDFFTHLFESGLLNRELVLICQEGARSHGLLNLSKSDFFGLQIPVPPKYVQDEIAERINITSKEIVILTSILDKKKEQKRGLMQKLLTGIWRVKF